MAAALNYNSIKKMFRKGEVNLPKFEILNYISQSVNKDGINSKGQELLLRVLDRKDEFMEYKYFFNDNEKLEKLKRFCETNFDMKDIVFSSDILKEVEEF